MVDVARTAYDHLDEWMSFDPSAPIPNDPAAIAKAQALYAFQSSSIIEDLTPGDLFTPAGVNMTTEDQILAPVSLHGDTFVAYEQLPLDEPDRLFNLTGTGNLMDPPPAVFDPANIVLLTDGQCASTCTLFSYLMIFGQKVKTVAVGGRPMPGPMQSIGGVEGAQIFYWDEISAIATATIALAPDLTGADPDLKTLDEGYAIFRSANPQQAGAVNGKNAFGPLDNQTPLQFLYQAANCRFFWTKDMVFNPDATWKRAVDATWTNPAQFCVEGSRVPLNMTTSGKTAVTFTRDMAVALGQ